MSLPTVIRFEGIGTMCEERRLAKLEFESGNYVLAAKFASYALAKNPDCFVSWDLLGHASLKTGWLAINLNFHGDFPFQSGVFRVEHI